MKSLSLRQLLPRLLALVLSSLLSLAALEAAIRLFDLWPAQRQAASSDSTGLPGDAAEREQTPYILHPYVGWTRRPDPPAEDAGQAFSWEGGTAAEWFRLNRRTNRFGQESAIDDYRALRSEDFAVGIVGGSVGLHLALWGGGALIDALQERRPELTGKIRIVNLAQGSYKQPQQLFRLLEILISRPKS